MEYVKSKNKNVLYSGFYITRINNKITHPYNITTRI